MAQSSQQEEVGGYSYQLADDVTSNQFICPICLLLMKDGVETSCGHCTCSVCLKRWERQADQSNMEATCPSCRDVYDREKTSLSKAFNRMITSSIKIKCEHSNMGCIWQGYISDIEEHIQKKCKFTKLNCPLEQCPVKVQRQHLEWHTERCGYRHVACPHCEVSMCYKDVEDHQLKCENFPTICPNRGCNAILPRKKIDDHRTNDCQFEQIQCEYADVGCSHKDLRFNMTKHLNDFVVHHTSLLHKDNKTTKDQLKQMQEKVKATENKLVATEKKLEATEIKLVDIENKLVGTKNKLEATENELQYLKAKSKEEYDATNIRLGALYMYVVISQHSQIFRTLFPDDEELEQEIANKLISLKDTSDTTKTAKLTEYAYTLKNKTFRKDSSKRLEEKNNFNFEDLTTIIMLKSCEVKKYCFFQRAPWVKQVDFTLMKNELQKLLGFGDFHPFYNTFIPMLGC